MEKANVTLYTVIGDSNRIVEAIRERFKEMTKEFVCEDETIDLLDRWQLYYPAQVMAASLEAAISF